jgi:hypothetical protein
MQEAHYHLFVDTLARRAAWFSALYHLPEMRAGNRRRREASGEKDGETAMTDLDYRQFLESKIVTAARC